jgi:hypothetical protein
MTVSSKEGMDLEVEKDVILEDASTDNQHMGTREQISHDQTKEDVESQHTTTPESDGHETEDDDEREENTTGAVVRPQSSRASSIFSRSRAVVPRRQRRGLFGGLAVIPEIERPHEYTVKTKWTITAIIALAAAAAPMGAGIFYRTWRLLSHAMAMTNVC